MKTQILPKLTLGLLAATALLFTGCSSDANGVDSNPVVQNTNNTQTENTTQTNTNTAPANNTLNVSAPQEQKETQEVEATEAEEKTSAPQAVKNESVEVETVNVSSETTEEEAVASKVSQERIAAFLDAINAARAETQDCGSEGVFDPADALSWNDRLGNAAWEHSNDMAESNTFSHTGSGTQSDLTAQNEGLDRGSRFNERIENQGYTEYRTVGENIAAGYATAQEVVEGWLASDHHCANLMNPKFTEVGMALVEKEGSEYGTYWSQEFGGK